VSYLNSKSPFGEWSNTAKFSVRAVGGGNFTCWIFRRSLCVELVRTHFEFEVPGFRTSGNGKTRCRVEVFLFASPDCCSIM
jgi:hypothetical protein